ncbi:adenylate/guanylate cyclase domain-containing protein [Acetobacter lambici]|uniref:Adenylate/guanylate cyclase domain-containing protein n=1 Tax=Acetobacter lambici TaxID=1332824 RepID=A0ABT1F750_9PROT|nr:adenylate/guanylate cyclase domain-containing protein [Acetobacter lambici]MCP1244168.1 adenylate/guanylate cyclase domain-containing protein [Acetobacter lambici]MCP1259933.1 adenylate/guanylate cyclase domain-containing protein [Acetobacter lambici]NHO58323.1 adenylate/guanylate cyclase domain-containing protein [Acetobacter lambici]
MGLKKELNDGVAAIFRDQWTTRKGRNVPEPEDLKLSNDAVDFDRATILYADLAGSTALVDSKNWWFSAEIYKTFLLCAAKIVRSEGGAITSYDGDRIMGIWVGESQTCPAVRAALKINYAVHKIINPALASQYPSQNYKIKQVVGIDTSSIRAARTGVRGGNDLVWVGRAANYAAKLTDLDLEPRTWITADAYNKLRNSEKLASGKSMWKQYSWTQKDNIKIYGSTYWWPIND